MNRNAFSGALLVLLLLVGSAMAVFAGGEQEAEEASEIEMEVQPRQYISPQSSDGTQDTFSLPFDYIPAGEAVPVGYQLTIYNSDGDQVYLQQERVTERRNFFERLLNQPKPQVELPDSFTWDGTYLNSEFGDDGEPVPEGEYSYQISVRDDEGEVRVTPPFGITVDNTAPTVRSLQPPRYTIFSPNDDGIRDTIELSQETSREQAWTGTILNADGEAVWRTTWESERPQDRAADVTPPATVTWDGTYKLEGDDRTGERVPEGTYTYQLSATDRAGNSTTQAANYQITLSLQAGDVRLAVRGNGVFSPNGDGTQDTVTLETTVAEPEGLDTWDLEIVSADDPDDLIRRFSGTGSVPDTITWDGVNRRNRQAADGDYRASLRVQYINGNVVQSGAVAFTVDTRAPQARVQATTQPEQTERGQPFVFGGEDKPRVEISARLSEGDDWTAVLETPEDTIRADVERYGFSPPEISYTWDGSGPDGTEMPDGVYSLYFTATDPAGNSGESNTLRVRKFTRPTPIDLAIEGDRFTPNDDGENDTITITPQFEVAELIDQFLLEIRNDDGFVVRSLYKSAPFESFEWEGNNNAGQPLEEGDYTVDFQIIYYNGNKPEVEAAGPITLVRELPKEPKTPPEAELTASPLPFSPDGDGYRDQVQFELRAFSKEPIESWTLEIFDPAGNTFITFSGEGEPDTFLSWDGRARDDELIQAASDYRAVLTVTDSQGLTGTAETVVTTDVLVFRDDQGRLLINVPSIHFAGFSADLFDVERSELEQNLRTLRRVADVLKKYPEYEITIEGHAAHIYYREGQRKQTEQEEVLIPLSRDRAQEVKEALIILGLDRARMETRGVGGRNPVVPHSDRENLWKNRRVVFILEDRRQQE